MRLEPRTVAGLLSVLLHLVILSALVRVATGSIDAPRPPEQEATADKLREAGEHVARVELRPGLLTSGLPCSGSSYVGVGVLLPALWKDAWTITASAILVGGTFMVITLAGVQEMRARAATPGHAASLVGRVTAAFAFGQIAGPVMSAVLLRLGPRGLMLALATGAAALFATAAWLWRAGAAPSLSKELSNG